MMWRARSPGARTPRPLAAQMKSSSSTSRTALLELRAMMAAGMAAVVSTGRTRWRAVSRSVGSRPIGPIPAAGNHPSSSEKIQTRINPSQKIGIVPANTTSTWSVRSRNPSVRKAASAPATSPTTKARMKLGTPRRSVLANRSNRTSLTGERSWIDVPRSPVTVRPSQRPYCTGTGWSNARAERMVARSSSLA